MPRLPRTFPDTYAWCAHGCGRWINTADQQQGERAQDGTGYCWRHKHLAPKGKSRIAFSKEKKGKEQMGLAL